MKQCEACRTRVKSWTGSDPKCAFSRGEWSTDNWNCATTGLLRRLFDEDGSGELPEGVLHQWTNDQNTGMVCAQGLRSDDGPVSLWITWYKDRGRTEQVWLLFDDKPPRRPTEAEILELARFYGISQHAMTTTVMTEIPLEELKANWIGDPPLGGWENYIERNGVPLKISEGPATSPDQQEHEAS